MSRTAFFEYYIERENCEEGGERERGTSEIEKEGGREREYI